MYWHNPSNHKMSGFEPRHLNQNMQFKNPLKGLVPKRWNASKYSVQLLRIFRIYYLFIVNFILKRLGKTLYNNYFYFTCFKTFTLSNCSRRSKKGTLAKTTQTIVTTVFVVLFFIRPRE